MGCRREGFPQPYLGLLLSIHKLPLSAYTPYIQKADRYLSCWQARFLNTMGRAVLVNSVLNSQLVYFMSSLQLPPSVIHQMDRRRRAFLWSGDKNGKTSPATFLVAWTTVCGPRDVGGLGIKDMGTQNLCLLLKLLHGMHHPDSSAWARWVHGRAFVATLQGDVHGAHWEVLRSLLPLYQALTTVQLGDGRSCSFWLDIWCGDESLADMFPALYSHCIKKEAAVQEMIDLGIQNALVPRLSVQASAELVQAQLLVADSQLTSSPDIRQSPFCIGNGSLDSGAIYQLLKSRGQPEDSSASFVWKTTAPPRVQFFMWLLIKRRIQCRKVLHRKCILPDATCEVCNAAEETPEHVISGCSLGRLFWDRIGLPEMLGRNTDAFHSLSPPSGIPALEFLAFFALCCWQI